MVNFYIIVMKVFKYLEINISWTNLKIQPRCIGNKKYPWTAGMADNFSIIIENIFRSRGARGIVITYDLFQSIFSSNYGFINAGIAFDAASI